MSRGMAHKGGISWNQKCILCIFPGLIGTAVFALIPFVRVIYYSFIKSQFNREWVGLRNYISTWQNEYFQLAMRNSLRLMVLCVPVLILLAIVISLMLVFVIRSHPLVKSAFILPMVIPTAGIVVIWKLFFSGMDNILPVYVLFIWKNIGICVILLTAEFASVPKEVYEAAVLEGISWWKIDWYITLPIAAPTILFSTLLSIMNSYKIFKESYLYYGTNYPPDYGYTLQYYMNNHFLKLNYQSLAVSSVYSAFFAIAIVAVGLRLIRRYQ